MAEAPPEPMGVDDLFSMSTHLDRKRPHMTIQYASDGEEEEDGNVTQPPAPTTSVIPATAYAPARAQHKATAAAPPPSSNDANLRPHDASDEPWELNAMRKAKPVRSEIHDQEALVELEEVASKYSRPIPTASYLQDRQQLDFYLFDLDYYVPYPEYNPMLQNQPAPTPQFRAFCLTPEGYSSVVYITDFLPYFHCKLTKLLLEQIDTYGQIPALEEFRDWLNKRAQERDTKRTQPGSYVRHVTLDKRKDVYGYHADEMQVLRIETGEPRFVPLCRDVLMGREPRAPRWGGGDGDAADDNNAAPAAPTEEELRQSWLKTEQSRLDGRYGVFQIYEADIAYALNFLVDKQIVGCGWFRVHADSVIHWPRAPTSRCKIEFHCKHTNVKALVGKSEVPNVDILSVDLECAGKNNRFPKPQEDPIICATVILYRLQKGIKPIVSLALCVGSVAECPNNITVIQFGRNKPVVDPKTGQWNKEAEIDMLLALHRFICEIADPDFWSGYNSDNFDTPYLFRRADALGIGPVFRRMSRLRDELCHNKAATFSSGAFGTRTDLNLHIPGRATWDVLRIVRRQEKERSYALNYIARTVIGKSKHEISHDQIGPGWLGPQATNQSRRRVLVYNEYDARISYEITAKKLYMYLYQELARVSGVTIDIILKRGQGIKSTSLLLRQTRQMGYLIPTFSSFDVKCRMSGFADVLVRQEQEKIEAAYKKRRLEARAAGLPAPEAPKKDEAKRKLNADGDMLEDGDPDLDGIGDSSYKGATVIDLIVGLFLIPVLTFDYQSLYPSIMILFNLSYDTWLPQGLPQAQALGFRERPRGADGKYIRVVDLQGVYHAELDGDYIVTPAGHYFVTKKIRHGIMPQILEGLLAQRKIAKDILSAIKKAKECCNKLRKGDPTVSFEQLQKLHTALEELVAKTDAPSLPIFTDEIRPLLTPATLHELFEQYDSKEKSWDAKQNALKITANSIYGFMGAVKGQLPCRAVAESVTSFGREFIEMKRAALEREFVHQMPAHLTQNGTMAPIVLGGDTDSVFAIMPGCDTPELVVEWGLKGAKWLNDNYHEKPLVTIFEKFYLPAEYIAPKRYGGRKWQKANAPDQVPRPDGKGTWDQVDMKGIESVRRDNFTLLADLQQEVLRKVLCEGSVVEAAKLAAAAIDDLRTGKADLAKLVISKSLSKEPEKYDPKPVHAQLAIKLAERDSATAPRVGDRVPYILVKPDKVDAKISSCGEDPAHVLHHNIPIHSEAYIDMLRKPLERVFEPIVMGLTNFLFDGTPLPKNRSFHSTLEARFAGIAARPSQPILVEGTKEHRDMAKKKKIRIKSDHEPSNRTLDWARQRSKVDVADLETQIVSFLKQRRGGTSSGQNKCVMDTINKASPLLRRGFAQVLPACAQCGQPAQSKDSALCGKCASNPTQARKKTELDLLEKKKNNDERWKVCSDCTEGNMENAEVCSFKECGNFFARTQTRKDLEKVQALLSKLDLK